MSPFSLFSPIRVRNVTHIWPIRGLKQSISIPLLLSLFMFFTWKIYIERNENSIYHSKGKVNLYTTHTYLHPTSTYRFTWEFLIILGFMHIIWNDKIKVLGIIILQSNLLCLFLLPRHQNQITDNISTSANTVLIFSACDKTGFHLLARNSK